MKKFYPILLLFFSTLTTNAKQLTPQEALARLSFPSTRASESSDKINQYPALTLNKDGLVTLYVFNKTSNGYVIVSGDDCAAPLLGYSESKDFDPNNIPPQLQWWLDFYSGEIEYAATNNVKYKNVSTRSDLAQISPMLTTKWNQGSPYNNDCPSDNGSTSVTGCVATAMAQAMKYHNYPEKGTGQNSYSWNNQTLSMNFSNITFDWQNMTDTYDSSSSQKEIDAVAQLMYACGISVNMDYSSSESGASSFNIGPALYQYFGYSADMVMPSRAFYTTSDWNNLVYEQLANGMPVLYGGQSNEGGHEFVCDGYNSDGYFHFNWGWSGLSDGYYLLSALDPMTQGIGGSTSGFNYDQSILLNMTPASKSNTVSAPVIYCYGDFTTQSSRANLGEQVKFSSSSAFYNFGVKTISATLGVEIKDAKGNSQYLSSSTNESFEVLSGCTSFNVSLPQNLSDGNYTLTPVYKTSDSNNWMDVPIPLSSSQSINMIVSNGKVTFSNNSPQVSVTDLKINSNIYLDTNFKASITIKNDDNSEYYAQLMFGLMDSNGDSVTETSSAIPVDLNSGESDTFDFITEFPSQIETSNGNTENVKSGNYYLVLFDMISGNVIYEYPEPVTVSVAPQNTELNVTNFGLSNGTTIVTDASDIQFKGTVNCVEGYYADQLIIAVFPKGATTTSIEGSTDYLFLDAGQSADFTASVSVSGASTGDEYFALVYTEDKTQLTNPLYFTIGNIDTGINEIYNQANGDIKYYNLNGLEISKENLSHGLYIIKERNHSRKIMIK